jgi:hypothetical protein
VPDEEPHLGVHFHPGEIPQVGGELPHAKHPVPINESVSYSIEEATEFNDEQGRHVKEEYESVRFFLGADGRGTFTFMRRPGGSGPGAVFSIEGSGTRTADEDRVEFRSEGRGLSGVFLFPRGGEHGEITLTHGSVHLKGQAVVGAGTL